MAEGFDREGGNRFFSAACFNRTWDLLDKKDRSAAETEAMIHTAHASLWHWLERPDVTHEKRSIGDWLLSRVYAEAGMGDRALHYGGLSVEEAESGELEPFYLGYAFEAIARAYLVQGHGHEASSWKARAQAEAAKVIDMESRALLEGDLAALQV